MGALRTFFSSVSQRTYDGLLTTCGTTIQWRYIAFTALILFETITVTRPYPTPFVTRFVNPFFSHILRQPRYLPFQQIVFARKIIITLSIAFSQLGPLVAGGDPTSTDGPPKALTQEQQLDRLDNLSRMTDSETTRLMGLDLAPFAGDEAGLNDLRSRLREWLVQTTVRSDPEVRNAVGEVMKRRRVGAPAGAKGTR